MCVCVRSDNVKRDLHSFSVQVSVIPFCRLPRRTSSSPVIEVYWSRHRRLVSAELHQLLFYGGAIFKNLQKRNVVFVFRSAQISAVQLVWCSDGGPPVWSADLPPPHLQYTTWSLSLSFCFFFNQRVYPDHQRGGVGGGFVCLRQDVCVCVSFTDYQNHQQPPPPFSD